VNDNILSSIQAPLLIFPISAVSCPHCSAEFNYSCENLAEIISCLQCNRKLTYIDGFLNHYRRKTDIFIDPVHPIPIAPGYTVGGEIRVIPDEIQVVDYGTIYSRPPQVFFLDSKSQPLRDLILVNHYIAAVSIGNETFILLSRTFDREKQAEAPHVRWMAVGEVGEHEKPIWISILQNAADLILKTETRAAFVMLQVAFDFYLDAVIKQIDLSSRDVKTATRRWKVSDRRAKNRLIENHFGRFPRKLTSRLIDLAEQRNRVVHGKVEKPDSRTYSSEDAFKIIIEAIITTNDMKYTYFRRENREITGYDEK